jgi:hypothetical protein
MVRSLPWPLAAPREAYYLGAVAGDIRAMIKVGISIVGACRGVVPPGARALIAVRRQS